MGTAEGVWAIEQRCPCDHQDLLGKLIEEGTLDPGLLDRLLGARTIFEYRNGKCFQKQASDLYLKIMYRDESAARSRCRFRRILRDGSCTWLELLSIIAMTANAFEEDKERALQNGMNAHIAKPLHVDSLLATLERILNGQQE